MGGSLLGWICLGKAEPRFRISLALLVLPTEIAALGLETLILLVLATLWTSNKWFEVSAML